MRFQTKCRNFPVAIVTTMLIIQRASACAVGYKCFEDGARSVTWVIKDGVTTFGPNCKSVCEAALGDANTFYTSLHDRALDAFSNRTLFAAVAAGLGVQCQWSSCWNNVATSNGQAWIASGNTSQRQCFLAADGKIDAFATPGNANCFGQRYALACPCEGRPVANMCDNLWQSPPHSSTTPTWPTNPNGTSCLERINYWRKRACEEGWPECPPQGLPPMVECLSCHECANSESQHDAIHGAHDSFTRCGEGVQGQGGGPNCAAVIDAFIAERHHPANNGKCVGHCGPIVAHGCQTFHWGRQDPAIGSFHTLNWRSCDTAKCNAYCDNPDENNCFSHTFSPAPLTSPPASPLP